MEGWSTQIFLVLSLTLITASLLFGNVDIFYCWQETVERVKTTKKNPKKKKKEKHTKKSQKKSNVRITSMFVISFYEKQHSKCH